jgi:hypothetical protein
MRIVIGIDSPEQAFADIEQPPRAFSSTDLTGSSGLTFAALQQTLHIFSPTDITSVHGVDLGRFEFPFGAEAANREQYEELRCSKLDASRRLLEHAASLIPKDGPSSRQVCDAQTPARLILDTAKAVAADTRAQRNPASPWKGSRPVEGQGDALQIQSWLTAYPFKTQVEVCVLTLPQALRFAFAMEFADKLVKTTAAAIQGRPIRSQPMWQQASRERSSPNNPNISICSWLVHAGVTS